MTRTNFDYNFGDFKNNEALIDWHPYVMPINGKQPFIKKWNESLYRPEISRTFNFPQYDECNVGLLTGIINRILVLDFDVTDETFAKEIRSMIKSDFPLILNGLVRIGNPPKFSIILSFDGEIDDLFSMKSEKFNGSRLEVFYQTKDHKSFQTAFSGIHPVTNDYFKYEGATPLDMRPIDLPKINHDFIKNLVDAFNDVGYFHAGIPTKNKSDKSKNKSINIFDGDFFQHLYFIPNKNQLKNKLKDHILSVNPNLERMMDDSMGYGNFPWTLSDLIRMFGFFSMEHWDDYHFYILSIASMKNLNKFNDPVKDKILKEINACMCCISYKFDRDDHDKHWRQNNFMDISMGSVVHLRDTKAKNKSVEYFINEKIDMTDDKSDFISIEDFDKEYSQWCHENGYVILNRTHIGKQLSKISFDLGMVNFKKSKMQINGIRKKYYFGIRLR